MSRPRFRRVPHPDTYSFWVVERWRPHPVFPWCGRWERATERMNIEDSDRYVAHQSQPPHYYASPAPQRINTDGEPE